jgi:hypothetical protein
MKLHEVKMSGLDPAGPGDPTSKPAPQHKADDYRIKGTVTKAPGDLNANPASATVTGKPVFGDNVTAGADANNGSYQSPIGKYNESAGGVKCDFVCYGYKSQLGVAAGLVTPTLLDDPNVDVYGCSVTLELDPAQQPIQ